MKLNIDADPEQGRPPLLLVHGLLSSRNHWLPNRSLSETFRLIRVDLPAHGLSPAPKDTSGATPEALVEAIEAVRDRLQIDRWYVCGQSFGAAVTLRYALTFPDRVLAQVFTNANGALRKALSRDADATDINGIALLLQASTPRLSVRDRLGELRVPTLLVNGLWEKQFQPERQWIAEAHPQIGIRDLEGGHSINIECPNGFNAAVTQFLSAGR
jgi:pimeloyl-ACP methyl ester carboxylesterase